MRVITALFLLTLGMFLGGCKAYGAIDDAYTAVKDTKESVDNATNFATNAKASIGEARRLLWQKIAKDDAADAALARGEK